MKMEKSYVKKVMNLVLLPGALGVAVGLMQLLPAIVFV